MMGDEKMLQNYMSKLSVNSGNFKDYLTVKTIGGDKKIFISSIGNDWDKKFIQSYIEDLPMKKVLSMAYMC